MIQIAKLHKDNQFTIAQQIGEHNSDQRIMIHTNLIEYNLTHQISKL